MADEQLLKEYYEGQFKQLYKGLPEFESLSNEERNSLMDTAGFAVFRFGKAAEPISNQLSKWHIKLWLFYCRWVPTRYRMPLLYFLTGMFLLAYTLLIIYG